MDTANTSSEPGLRFESFEVFQVLIPIHHGFGLPTDGRFDQQPIHLVRGKTNRGFYAIGEASRVDNKETVNRTLQDLLRKSLSNSSPATLWMEPSHREGPFAGLPRPHPLYSWETAREQSLFLLESLWLDAMGHAAGVPSHVLLGGAVRRQVKVDYWAAQPTTQELVHLVAQAHAAGCRGMKVKSNSEGNTVRSIREIAADLPNDFSFTVDAMFHWRSLHESRRIFEMMENVDVPIKVEDPFPFEAIDDWHQARRQYRQTLVWHTRGADDLHVALRENTADAFNIACRGAYEATHLAQILAFHAKDCWFGSQLEAGVFQQVRLYSASVAPTCVLPCDLQSQWVREHTLAEGQTGARDGCIELSDAPGLGVRLHPGALEKYTVARWSIA